VLLGSNGEFATLDGHEREAVVEAGVAAVAGRRVVMAGTGAESTRRTIEQTRHAARAGVDFALVITPHYYKTRYDRTAMLRHYSTVAEASPIPILVYVMAAYTGLDLPTATIAELSRHPNIVGIKDSGGHAVKIADMMATVEPGFAVLAGSANSLLASLALGATGGIVALGNVAPAACKRLHRLFLDGRMDEARELQLRLMAPNAAVTTTYGIAGLKAALELVDLRGGPPRPPLLPLSDEERSDARATFDAAGLLGVPA
jgi:4-hydroxy-2-oxoglutarate aldolase